MLTMAQLLAGFQRLVGIICSSEFYLVVHKRECFLMNRLTLLGITMALCVPTASHVQAADLFWLGNSANLDSANYSDAVNTGITPTSVDALFIGNAGTANFTGTADYLRLTVGHNNATLGGAGTVNVSGGASLNLTNDVTGLANAALIVGRVNNGTMNIDGSTVQSTKSVVVGYGTNANNVGTLNISNGGVLNVLTNDLTVSERSNSPATPDLSGMKGVVTLNGETSQINVGNLLTIGTRSATGTYTQNDGVSSIGGNTTVGNRNADNSSLTVLGGTFETGGSVVVGTGDAATNGGQFVSGASITFGGDALVTLGGNFTAGLGDATDTSLTISGTAHVTTPHLSPPTSAGSVFIARGRSKNTTFTMTGGTFDVGTRFLMGSVETAVITAGGAATNIVGNQSGGVINTVLDFTLADTNGDSTYNLSGGEIHAGAYLIVGRQRKLGVMNQSNGVITAGQGVHIGNAFSADTAVYGTGVYDISGGSLTANADPLVNLNALSIAPAGTGTFRIIGDDALIDLNGDMLVNAGGGSQGTLAYRLKAGDSLSMIDVSGTATFNAGAILAFDTSLAAPTQTSYNLLTALDIVDNGIAFSGPAGWNYQIVSGLNGEILQAFQSVAVGVAGDYNGNGTVDAADYVLWRNGGPLQNEIATPGTVTQEDYDSWRARFGSTSGSGAGTRVNAGQVPEPAAAVLMIMGLMATLSRRGSRS